MRARPILGALAALSLIAIAAASCTPKQTDMQIRLTGNVTCAEGPRVLIRVGNESNIETSPAKEIASSYCEGNGNLGTLTITPPGDDANATIAINVIMAIGRDPATCSLLDAANCWLQRRVIPFLKGEQFDLPINFIASCITNLCGPGTTCATGKLCVKATVDAAQCLATACYPSGFPDEAKVTPTEDGATPLEDGQTTIDATGDGTTSEDSSTDDASDSGGPKVDSGKDGAVSLPDGAVELPDGAIVLSDGGVIIDAP